MWGIERKVLEALCESEYEIKPQTSHVELYRVLKERGVVDRRNGEGGISSFTLLWKWVVVEGG